MENLIWNRQIKLIFTKNNQKLVIEKGDTNQYLFFEIDINKDISGSSNIANITIYNLSSEMLSSLNENANVEIQAGYGDKLDTIYKGTVERIQGTREKVDIVHKITCSTYNNEYKQTKIDLKVAKNTSAKDVITKIISHFEKIKIGKIELAENIKYKDGKTIHNNLKSILKTIAKDTKSIFYISNGLLYFQKADGSIGTFSLNDNEIRNITQNENGYTITTNFNGKILEGMKFKSNFKDEITNINLQGEYLVSKIKHKLSFKGEFSTTFDIINEVIKKENEKEIKIVVGGSSKKQTSKKAEKRNIKLSDGTMFTI